MHCSCSRGEVLLIQSILFREKEMKTVLLFLSQVKLCTLIKSIHDRQKLIPNKLAHKYSRPIFIIFIKKFRINLKNILQFQCSISFEQMNMLRTNKNSKISYKSLTGSYPGIRNPNRHSEESQRKIIFEK